MIRSSTRLKSALNVCTRRAARAVDCHVEGGSVQTMSDRIERVPAMAEGANL